MASVLNLRNGRRAVQFVAPDGERRTIRLGKLSKESAADSAMDPLILRCRCQGQQATEESLGVGQGTVRRVGRATAQSLRSFAPRRKAAAVGLKQFLDEYVGKRTDVKRGTATFYGHTSRCLVDYFGSDRPLGEIAPGDVDEWRLWLGKHEKLAENTVRRRCGMAKQFFRFALRKRLIRENPFEGMKGCLVKENRERDYFVTMDEAAAVLESCPDAQWRLLFALSRFGGLRCPSEHLSLRWSDVDWERNRITVHSPKRSITKGRKSRHSDLSGTAAVLGSGLGPGRARDRVPHCSIPLQSQRRQSDEPWNPVDEDHSPRRSKAVAETLAKLA